MNYSSEIQERIDALLIDVLLIQNEMKYVSGAGPNADLSGLKNEISRVQYELGEFE